MRDDVLECGYEAGVYVDVLPCLLQPRVRHTATILQVTALGDTV